MKLHGCLAVVVLLLATPASALDLPTALAQVAEANPMLLARREMTAAAQARIASAGAWDPPMLEAGLVNVPQGGALDMDPMTMRMFGAAQRLPLSGSRGLARRAARHSWRAEAAGAEAMHWELMGEAWSAYADAYHASRLVHVATQHRDAMNGLVASARAQYAAGRGRLADLLGAESARARVLAELAEWDAEARAARARLDRMRGVGAGEQPDTLAPPPALDHADAAWRAALTPEHPALREPAARAEGLTLSARAARRMVWPDLEVRASWGQRGTLADGTVQDDMFSVTGAIMLPLFAGSRERAEGAERDAMARAAMAEGRAAELALREQLEQALAERSAAATRTALFADSVLAPARGAFAAARDAYTAGLGALVHVFDAEHMVFEAETMLVRARQEHDRATAMLVALAARADLAGPAPAPRRSQP